MKYSFSPRIARSARITLLVTAALCAATATASAQSVPYDLGTLPSGLSVQWPTAPNITRSVDVRTLSEFNQAAAVAGTLITIKTAISGRGTLNASDIEIQMDDGASLGGLFINRSMKRISLNGGQYTGTIEMALPSTFWPSRVDNPAWAIEDVMIDGIEVRAPDTAIFLRGHRVAVLRSFAHAGEYSVFSDTASNDSNTDVIIAGNDFESEGKQATVRLIGVRNSVTVDNRLTDLLLTGEKHNYRVHGVSDQVYAARNELVNAGTMLGTMGGDDIGHLWFDDNTFHHKTPDLFNPDTSKIHVLHAHNNVAYTDVWSCFYCRSTPSAWDLGNNAVHPYQPPPTLSR